MGSPMVLARSPSAHQPETTGGVRDGVMADLLESEIEQPVETDPRYGEPQQVRFWCEAATRLRRQRQPLHRPGFRLLDPPK
jgi:hypothetical protein